MEAQHNVTGYFQSKVEFIAAELRRLQCALEGRINAETGEIDCNVDAVTEIPVVRLAVDLRLQLGPFAEITVDEAAACGSETVTPHNAVQATAYFPKMPLDFFIGGYIVDNNVHVFEVDPDVFAEEPPILAAARARAAKTGKPAKRGAKRTEADGGANVGPLVAPTAAPIEIPPTHPFLAKASMEFIDNAINVTEVDEVITCEECPNVYKSMPPFKHMTQPVLLRSIPSPTTPLPSPFVWSDLPDIGNDELLCYCQGERLVIEEMTENFTPGLPPASIWSNFIGDADGIPSPPGTAFDPAVVGLHAVVTAEAVIYARADSLVDDFCCPTQITPDTEDCEDIDLKRRAPFRSGSLLLADGGVDMKDVMRAADKALADPGRPIGQAYSARVKGPVGGAAPFMRRRIVPRRVA